jgi:hypothetical protein
MSGANEGKVVRIAKPEECPVMTDFSSTSLKAPRRSKPVVWRKQAAHFQRRLTSLTLIAFSLGCPYLFAQQGPPAHLVQTQALSSGTEKPTDKIEALQKVTENTVASIMSVPIENKSNFDMGPYGRSQNIVNIKPLIPLRLSKHWRLIARIILPIQWKPYLSRREGGEFGLGDMAPTFFLSPAPRGTLVWGAGPKLIIPTATDRILGQGKFSLGPEIALFVQPGHWTCGILISNVWSVAGSRGRADVNQMQLQYFLSYRLGKGWDISASPIVSANWKAKSGNVWIVPVGGGLGKIVHFGSQPAKVSTKVYRNSVRPSGASSWEMHLQIEFLFPKRRKQQTGNGTGGMA